MKSAGALPVAVLVLALPLAVRADTPEVPAESVARSWLALLDAGDYARTWDSAASMFRKSISRSQWATAAANVHVPFGKLDSWQLQSAKLTHSLPGVPDGDYVLIQFRATFEHKVAAIETVTPMKDTDGQWRVSGYCVG